MPVGSLHTDCRVWMTPHTLPHRAIRAVDCGSRGAAFPVTRARTLPPPTHGGVQRQPSGVRRRQRFGRVSPRRNDVPRAARRRHGCRDQLARMAPRIADSGERCIGGVIPDFRQFHWRIQSNRAGSGQDVDLSGDISPGLGGFRNIPITTAPHLPATNPPKCGATHGVAGSV